MQLVLSLPAITNNHPRYKWATLKTRKIVYQPPPTKNILDKFPKPNTSGKTNQ